MLMLLFVVIVLYLGLDLPPSPFLCQELTDTVFMCLESALKWEGWAGGLLEERGTRAGPCSQTTVTACTEVSSMGWRSCGSGLSPRKMRLVKSIEKSEEESPWLYL